MRAAARGVIAAAAAVAIAADPAAAQPTLPAVLSDGMVIQQLDDVRIWGHSQPGATVHVDASWGGRADAAADDDGSWHLMLRTPAGSMRRHTITVADATGRISINDVLVGELWLCSGQSNMEWPLRASDGGPEAAAAAERPGIRFFQAPNAGAVVPADDIDASWVACSPETAGGFSAVAFWFAARVADELDVPVGILQSDFGGSIIETWTPAPALRAMGGFEDRLAEIEREAERRRVGDADTFPDQEAAWYRAISQRPPPTDRGVPWTAPRLDDRAWLAVHTPGPWPEPLDGFDGIAWYRTKFTLPADWGGAPIRLDLGAIDDCDTVWLNGQRIGETMGGGRWREFRRYEVPAGLERPGDNTLAIRVLDTRHSAGLRSEPHAVVAAGPSGQTLPLAGRWRLKTEIALSDLPPLPRPPTGRDVPASLFNGMVAPLTPATIRGVLWYQGESNRGDPARYFEQFVALIAAWRDAFDRPRLPFYFVQLAPFTPSRTTGNLALLREAQHMAAQAVAHTGMVVTMDIGDPEDIHPRNKRDVGERLAGWALADTYGRSHLPHRSPELDRWTIVGNQIILTFNNAEQLRATGPLDTFELAGADRVFHAADARIEGRSVVLNSSRVPRPVAARYAWKDDDQTNLTNEHGLPVAPARTDRWPPLTRRDPRPGGDRSTP